MTDVVTTMSRGEFDPDPLEPDHCRTCEHPYEAWHRIDATTTLNDRGNVTDYTYRITCTAPPKPPAD